jgi:hypothetical protein
VHDRLGEPCWRCGTPLAQVDFEEHTIYYAPRARPRVECSATAGSPACSGDRRAGHGGRRGARRDRRAPARAAHRGAHAAEPRAAPADGHGADAARRAGRRRERPGHAHARPVPRLVGAQGPDRDVVVDESASRPRRRRGPHARGDALAAEAGADAELTSMPYRQAANRLYRRPASCASRPTSTSAGRARARRGAPRPSEIVPPSAAITALAAIAAKSRSSPPSTTGWASASPARVEPRPRTVQVALDPASGWRRPRARAATAAPPRRRSDRLAGAPAAMRPSSPVTSLERVGPDQGVRSGRSRSGRGRRVLVEAARAAPRRRRSCRRRLRPPVEAVRAQERLGEPGHGRERRAQVGGKRARRSGRRLRPASTAIARNLPGW